MFCSKKSVVWAAAGVVALQGHSFAIEGKVGKYSDATITGHVLEPSKLEFTEEAARAQIEVPAGFELSVFAKDLVNPRMLAVAEDGTVYATRRSVGDAVMLKDNDEDGKADEVKTVASRPGMHGIAIHGQRIFLATVKDVYAADIKSDGSLGRLEHIIDDLPDGGQHPNRTLAIGPDGMLYITVGSTCNACDESSPESATILRASTDGKQRTIFASGLRNTIGFDWDPLTGSLYGMDHGIDWLGDDAQVEELNHIEKGKSYGWPYIYGMGEFNPQDNPPGTITLDDWRGSTRQPLLGYTPHAAPMQMIFYRGGQFPSAYEGDAFVAMRGSWNRKDPSGYEVVRVQFDDGVPKKVEPFVTGFLKKNGDGYAYIGRPTGLATAKDGSILIADDTNGVIYRLSHAQGKSETSSQRTGELRQSAARAPEEKPDGKIARELVKAEQTMQFQSPKIADGSAIPHTFSAYGEDISPPLTWSGAPEGSKSFVLIVDDPDAKSITPFTHWVAYNIPANVNELREGLPARAAVEDIPQLRQGVNSRGSIGYFGPKPPPNDGEHRYYFQIFALDRMLNLQPGASREQVLDAMSGAVLAQGDFVGLYGQR